MECCQGQGQIGDQDPVNRQLFNKTICEFREKVVAFYDKVQNAKPVSEAEVINYIQVQPVKPLNLKLSKLYFRPRFTININRPSFTSLKRFKIFSTTSKNMKIRFVFLEFKLHKNTHVNSYK